MKASIYDYDAMYAVGASELGAYLRSSGWFEKSVRGNLAAIWQKRNDAGEEFEVLVPQQRSLDDYIVRVAQTLETLSVVEDRSALDIYADILRTQTDTVRLQFHSSLFEDGSVPLDQAVRMMEGAREMALAAACATLSPRAVYPKRKPQQAIDYLNKIRMGQTERGSFVLALHTHVPPRLRVSDRIQPEVDMDLSETEAQEPFERRVGLTLAYGLYATLNAALRANAKGDLTPFQDAITAGVSSNLCDALASFGETAMHSLNIDFQWSPTRILLRPVQSHVEFTSDHFDVLKEAARLFRAIEPINDYEVVGYVVHLDREPGNSLGQVTIAGMVDDSPRRIRVSLDDAGYQLAVKAHGEKEPVQCAGELVKEGRSYILKNPRNFSPIV